jgi:hypothetical protein
LILEEVKNHLTKRTAIAIDSYLTPVDEKDIWRNYDPKEAWHSLERLAGKWSSIDTGKLAGDVRRWRKEGSRP